MYLDYAGVRVTNLAKATRFVTKGLGLAELRRGKMDHGGVWVLFEDRASHQQLELNWYPKGSRYDTPFVAGEGLDHLGFRTNDLEAAGRQVRAAGGKKVEEIRYRGKVVLAYYEGPDGLWVELILSPSV
ncbi:MAG: VOC family protein [Thermoplasmata archaeon]|jgi:catechol 2,3-dioxygenase-like lactoylglutathione lyase family enzyme